MKKAQPLYRIIDANFNRSKEAFRVCEDIARYVWNEKTLTRSLKDMRHKLTEVIGSLGILKIVEGRDVLADVGRPSSASELKRSSIEGVFFANMQRLKESLRVLEEIAKLLDPKVSEGLKTLRYNAYVVEKKAIKKR